MVESEEIRTVIERILTVVPDKQLYTLIPTHLGDPNLRLEVIARNILEERHPTVLWNVRPFNTFNFLHAIYCQKLKELQEIGFNVVIIVYDKLVEKTMNIGDIEKYDFELAVNNNITWILNAGLKEKNTEFLLESDLWSFINFKNFAETITSLAHLFKFDPNLLNRERIASVIMDNLCEIYYEDLITCDIVLTGDIDAQQIWGGLRRETYDTNLFKDYSPPLVLSFPILNGIDKKPLTTYKNDNTLSIHHKEGKLKEQINNAQEDFLENLIDFLIIPYCGINKDKVKYSHSFKELKTRASTEEIYDIAYENTKQYFNRIR